MPRDEKRRHSPAFFFGRVQAETANRKLGPLTDENASGSTQILGSTPVPDRPAPERIGGMRILSELGAGGMGRVYACHDEGLDRTVAVKTLLPEVLAQPGMKDRFVREARALARVRSNHVVAVFQVGEEDGVPFMVMEYLEGDDLDGVLKEGGPLDEKRAVDFTLQAIDGLAAAQAAGIIHRDVKPANLYIADENDGTVKLTDFGLARPMDGSADLTQAGLVVGSPHYLAPELARGKTATVQSDIYALGATLFEMLSGKPPFTGNTPLEVLTSHLTKPLPELSAPVSPQLRETVRAMLAKEAQGRPDSYESLAMRLKDALNSPGKTPVSDPAATPATAALPASSEKKPTGSSGTLQTLKTANLTVLMADIVGYSERTGQQSREAAANYLALFEGLLQPVFKAFGGKVVKKMGDAFLTTFASPTDGVLCAMAIQDRLFVHNQEAGHDDEIRVRIGVSAGEVRRQKGDVFGEPVNVAARLESMAEPGAVLLSDAVYATMNTAEVALDDHGEHTLKGISRPVRVYRARQEEGEGMPFGGRALSRVDDAGSAAQVAAQAAAQAVGRVGAELEKAARAVGKGRSMNASVYAAAGGGMALVVGLVLMVLLGGDNRLEKIDAGKGAEVLAAIKKTPPEKRDGEDELLMGHALWSLGKKQSALSAYVRAEKKGERDERVKKAALSMMEEKSPDTALDLLVRWPANGLNDELVSLAENGEWEVRHNALDALNERNAASEELQERVAIKDLLDGKTCGHRKYGLNLLKRVGKGEDAQEAIAKAKAKKRFLKDACLAPLWHGAETAIRGRSGE
jgi:serine/threonine protein kinase